MAELDDWTIPTFREVALPVETFGMAPEHFSLAILLGSAPSLVLVFVSTFGHSVKAFIFAGILAGVLIPSLMFMLRSLHKSDRNFAEHWITHRYPAERFLGK